MFISVLRITVFPHFKPLDEREKACLKVLVKPGLNTNNVQ